MASKIRVYGEAQNRTALGIIHAYMVLNPKATIDELRKAFPDSLASDKSVTEMFVDSNFDDNGDHYFTEADELVETNGGRKVAVVKLWTKPTYDRLVKQAADYGIEVAEFEPQHHVGKKGSYYIEYVNGFTPDSAASALPPYVEDDASKRKGCSGWLWGLLALIVLVILLLLFAKKCSRGDTVAMPDSMVERTVIVEDGAGNANGAGVVSSASAEDASAAAKVSDDSGTRASVSSEAVALIEKYQAEFDATEYPVGQYELKPEAKAILDKVATVLKDNPGIRMTVNGYASREGNPEANQVLSDRRASTVVKYLVSKGIDAARLKAVGLNSNNPVSDKLSPNRRVDFVVE